jgi:hypothetical protein
MEIVFDFAEFDNGMGSNSFVSAAGCQLSPAVVVSFLLID